MPPYFAYGSNMDRSAMARRCPGASPLGAARLDGHRFFIMAEGYASIRPEAGSTVHGLLWDLPAAAIPALDGYEEVEAGLYRRLRFAVDADAGMVGAIAYVGLTQAAGAAQPGYMEAIVTAAEELALPVSYRAELRGWLPRPDRGIMAAPGHRPRSGRTRPRRPP